MTVISNQGYGYPRKEREQVSERAGKDFDFALLTYKTKIRTEFEFVKYRLIVADQ